MPSGIPAIERGFFRSLNALAEPLVRAGIGSPSLCVTGVIVLETIGRRSGRRHRTPVFAMEIGDCLLAGTARERSDWLRNIEASPDVRYWLRGTPHDARAFVFKPSASPGDAPARVREIASTVQPAARALGIRFAVVVRGDANLG